MPTARVQLPDGSIIRLQIPKDATPEQIRAFAKQHAKEEAVIKKLLSKIEKPKDGKDGKDGTDGKNGVSVRGDKGEPGIDGVGIQGKKGQPGKDGISIVDVNINKKKELITTLSNGKKINAGKITEKLASDVFEIFYTNPLKNTVNLGTAIGDMIAFNGKSWDELSVGASNQYIVPNPLKTIGVAWQERGFSYLTDEAGNILTDENGDALEGKDAIDAVLLVNTGPQVVQITSADSPYTVISSDDIIEATMGTSNIDILLLPLTNVERNLLIMRNKAAGGEGTGKLDVIANGSEKIKEPGGVLINNKVINGDGNSLNLAGVNSVHYNII